MMIIPLFLGMQSSSIAQECYWSSHARGQMNDGANHIAIDQQGNTYIAGYTYSDYCFFDTDTIRVASNEINQLFLAKYNSSGNEVWIKEFGLYNPNVGESIGGIAIDTIKNVLWIAVNQEQQYVSLTVFIMKMDYDGNVIWARTGGGTGKDVALGLTNDGLGNVYISGGNEYTASFNDSTIYPGGFLAKYDFDGNLIWVKNIFRFNEASLENIVFMNNKLFVNGNTFADTIVVDTIKIVTNASTSSYLASFTSEGNINWIKLLGGPNGFCGSQIATENNENIYITGTFVKTGIFGNDTLRSMNYDCFLSKVSINGDLLWVRQLNSNPVANGYGVATSSDGGVYLSGDFYGTAHFGDDTLISSSTHKDLFLVLFSPEGACEGVRHYGTAEIPAIAVDKTENLQVTGSFENTLSIGPNPFPSHGFNDIFVAKCSAITGIEEKNKPKQPQLLIYANPTKGKCNITRPHDFRNEKNLLLQIFDNQGKMIKKNPIEVSDEKIGVDISEEAKGIYHVILSDGKKNYSGTIILD